MLGAEVADVEPTELVAVTTTRIVRPPSAATSRYLLALAPGISTQAPPEASQRRHWYVYEIGVEPVQVPFDVLMLFPTMAGPVMAGRAVFLGGAR